MFRFVPSSFRGQFFSRSRASFTLVELLVVIAIVAILSVVVIMTLNPVELLRQSRDSNRVADLATLNTALSTYNADQSSGSLGSATVVYVSVPDSSATCANLGLPSLPSGYTYACSTSANYRKVDGTGWVPVDFTQVSAGAPLSSLPVDPVSATSTGLYYTYVPGGSWKVSAVLESNKYLSKTKEDGGTDPVVYEVGTDMALGGSQRGLSVYWNFDVASTSVLDVSGNGNHATMVSSPTTIAGKINQAMDFSGVNYISAANATSIDFGANQDFTIMAWIKSAQAATLNFWPAFFIKEDGAATRSGYILALHNSTVDARWFFSIYSAGSAWAVYGTSNVADGNWHHVTGVRQGSTIYAYEDGMLANTAAASAGSVSKNIPLRLGTNSAGSSYSWYDGAVDEARVYNRALSAQEIKKIYDATR